MSDAVHDSYGKSEDRQMPYWPRGMREELAALYLSMSVTMLRAKVAAGEIHPPVHLSTGRIIYLKDHLDAYLDRLFGVCNAPAPGAEQANEWDAAFGGSN